MIGKNASNPLNGVRRAIPFASARRAFRAVLQAAGAGGKVLLPAYIGWSPKEGSGVFDPVRELGLEFRFYALDERLRIDLNSLGAELARGDVRVLVLIHYFGRVDPRYTDAVRLGRERGAFIVEDEAHAMFSDLVGGICGRLGDAAIYSFHKLLPVESGGALVLNEAAIAWAARIKAPAGEMAAAQFDLHRIAEIRRTNWRLVDGLIRESGAEMEPLFSSLAAGEIPQSYPVLIRHGSRDDLYRRMNAAGFGVVSLYHTLIAAIDPQRFPESARTSRLILNLPVHQDAAEGDLVDLVDELACAAATG